MDAENITVYNRSNPIRIGIEDIVKYHGGLCPGILIGFKATKLAVESLWGSETPRRDDILIVISNKMRPCAIDALEFITRAKTRDNLIIKPTEKEGIDWSFIFVRKTNNKAVEVVLKERISPNKTLPKKKRGEFNNFIQKTDMHELFDLRDIPYEHIKNEISRPPE